MVRPALGASVVGRRLPSGPRCWPRSRRSTSAARPTSWRTSPTSGSRCGHTRRRTRPFVWDGRELVAFAWLKAMPGEREAHRVGCWGGVRPSHRRQGIGTQLFDWMLHRGRRDGGRASTRRCRRKLQTRCRRPPARPRQPLAARAGFEPVRRFLEVARPAREPVPDRARRRPASSWCRGAPSSTRRRAWPRRRPSSTTGGASRAPRRSGRSGTRATAASVPTSRCSPSTRPAARSRRSCSRPPTRRTGSVAPVEAWINTVGTRRAWRGKGVARWVMADVHRRIAGVRHRLRAQPSSASTPRTRPAPSASTARLGFAEDVRSVTTLSQALRSKPFE